MLQSGLDSLVQASSSAGTPPVGQTLGRHIASASPYKACPSQKLADGLNMHLHAVLLMQPFSELGASPRAVGLTQAVEEGGAHFGGEYGGASRMGAVFQHGESVLAEACE